MASDSLEITGCGVYYKAYITATFINEWTNSCIDITADL